MIRALDTLVAKCGNVVRGIGASVDSLGASLEGRYAYTEHLSPTTRVVSNTGNSPTLADDAFIALNASVIGNVTIGAKSSVWYGTTLRGDVNSITIGDNTNIQDNAMIHSAKLPKEFPTVIGNNVTVGPRAIIHAATVQDGCIIGTGSQVLDGAVVSKESMLAAGSILSQGKTIPAGQLWSGIPARMVRDLTSEEIEFMKNASVDFANLATEHATESKKTFEELQDDEDLRFHLEHLSDRDSPIPPEKREKESDEDDHIYYKF